ncbi:hypothetical protein CISG_00131 [Coccidioides immitis RMSCC 3703]|uniref:Uncharacterized protein n=1 Tax=Coccidioides immitis RMSCC 3703 TaxID=454286 RepID=A0A0J8QH71_COCIT|nr:hypothetical protein CISG_00131 [Coccidioides immitis RMSCC 3703]
MMPLHRRDIVRSSSSVTSTAAACQITQRPKQLSARPTDVEAELRQSGASERVKMLLVEPGQIATQLFQRVETPNKFFAPVLEPVQVAREIVSVVDTGNGGVLRMPAFASFVSCYAVLPASIQKFARYLSGIDRAMQRAGYSADHEMESLKRSKFD